MNTITEVDETTPRVTPRLSESRLETVLTDYPRNYEAEMRVWVQRSAAYCFFFIILQITQVSSLNISFSFIPLFILDLKIVIWALLSKDESSLYNRFFSKSLLHQICSLTFKLMLIYHYQSKSFNSMLMMIPLVLAFLNHFFHKSSSLQECEYLTWLIVCISLFFFILTVLNYCLYFEDYVIFEPSGLLWPVYVGLCFCGVMVVGLVLFALGSLLSWSNEEISRSEFLVSIWLLLTTFGATLTLVALSVKLARKEIHGIGKASIILAIVYLALFTLVTTIFIKQISLWWKFFFNSGNDFGSVDIPLPVSHAARQITFQSRVSKTIKKAPRVLLRISSSYFKPADTPKAKYQKRTLSLKTDLDDTVKTHKRHNSDPSKTEPTLEVLSPTAKDSIDKICEMCCERLCNAVVMDCGHGGICYECSLEMWKSVGHCHMCRGCISQVLQIEQSGSKLVKVHSTTLAAYYDQDHP